CRERLRRGEEFHGNRGGGAPPKTVEDVVVDVHLDVAVALHPFLARETLAAGRIELNAPAGPPELANAPARARTESGPDVMRVFRVDQDNGRGDTPGALAHETSAARGGQYGPRHAFFDSGSGNVAGTHAD